MQTDVRERHGPEAAEALFASQMLTAWIQAGPLVMRNASGAGMLARQVYRQILTPEAGD